ncbi:cleavage and polyadenylation specificity factor subunit 5 [Babesia ovis]|uniref:Cleavage and polyadenylation specificity factor subunit 5 n=1 Tax=Babesia ovis TaxID=5869 RepID=A0A9W5WUK9_BABOV|nr:cleavage and polyadenylation specificity factor subunit 5 [Babesia ovis]
MAAVCVPRLLMSFLAVCFCTDVAALHEANHNYRQLSVIQKVYTRLPACSALKPESVTMDTICLSSCGTAGNDSSLVCNPQAETWKIRLAVDTKSGFAVTDGRDNTYCQDNMKRFKCLPYESTEMQCSDASFDSYPPGFSCFTQCGELKCPSNDYMTPTAADDFKLADCKSSYRVRCRIHPKNENQLISAPDLTMELQLGRRQYGQRA